MYRTQIFDITRKFNEDDWSVFIRDKLNLDDETIDQIEDSQASRSEKKYRTAKKWMNLGEESNNLEKLCSLSGISVEIENAKEVELKATPAISAEVSGRERPEKKKGCALIISNGFEYLPTKERAKASKADLKHMKDLWKTEMGCSLYENKVHENLSADEMRQKFKDFAKMRQECDYVVVYISTHGSAVAVSKNGGLETCTGGFYGEDKKPVSEDELMYYFQNNRSSLEGVTKFFILDYSHIDEKGIKSDPFGEGTKFVTRGLMPLLSDIITIYTTGFTSDGGRLTTSLYTVFKEHWKTHSLTNMLMMVNKRMKIKGGDRAKARPMSIFESSLDKDFTF